MGGGGLGVSHKGAAYSNLISPQPNFGCEIFLGWVGLRAERPPPPPPFMNKAWLECTPFHGHEGKGAWQ